MAEIHFLLKDKDALRYFAWRHPEKEFLNFYRVYVYYRTYCKKKLIGCEFSYYKFFVDDQTEKIILQMKIW